MRSFRSCALFFILFIFISSDGVRGQTIPNAGFENWTSGEPDSWLTSNILTWITVAETLDAHSGTRAVRGTVIEIQTGKFAPYLLAGDAGNGFPVNARPGSFHGWYKFAPLGDERITMVLTLSKSNPYSGVGLCSLVLSDPKSVYSEFAVDFTYVLPDIPDTCFLSIAMTTPTGTAFTTGSTFIIDDLSFGPATGVDEAGNVHPVKYALAQNYPNPFNPITHIQYEIPRESRVTLALYDMLGRAVTVLVDEQQTPGVYRADFDGTGLASGVYFYRLKAGAFSDTKKLQLVK
jgi:hypothetical protein